ncbi:hypothetical protein DVS77_27480 [Mycolicibacterium moriokaense]|nr:hypothetical protein DVS77_27480 [Mycolicibacterium moriokaense]
MPTTLQLDLSAVREATAHVADVAGNLAVQGVLLRLPVMPPATDAITIHLCRRTYQESRRLAYSLESAGDELARAAESILSYAYDAATLARRTELALMGLEIEAFVPSSEPSAMRSRREAGTPPPPAEVPDELHACLSQAVLLSNGRDFRAQPPVDIAHLRAAAAALYSGARTLRAAMSSGDRPAAMLDRFAAWIETDVAAAAEALNTSVAQWASAYGTARDQVLDRADIYRGWLAAAVAGVDRGAVDLPEAGAHVRATLRGYASLSIAELSHPAHPRLGARD